MVRNEKWWNKTVLSKQTRVGRHWFFFKVLQYTQIIISKTKLSFPEFKQVTFVVIMCLLWHSSFFYREHENNTSKQKKTLHKK